MELARLSARLRPPAWPLRRPRRRGVTIALGVLVLLPVPVAAHLVPLHRDGSLASADVQLSGEDGTLQIVERGYRLALQPHTGRVTVATSSGHEYTGFPLAMSGALPMPRHSRRVSRRVAGTFESQLLDSGGRVLEEAVLQPSAASFTVRYAARPELLGTGPVRFFDDGTGGVDLAEVSAGYTPDPTRPALMGRPVVGVSGRTPFSPPPFQLQLHTAPGWLGIGLVEVPAATAMGVDPDGGIGVDYPSTLVQGEGDLGAGPPEDGMVRFPEFVVTMAADPLAGLRAYHDALSPLDESAGAAPPGTRPGWWGEPFVDTWGEQVVSRSARSSPTYTADWVRAFVAEWRHRFGAGPITVVIDSRWQERIGDPQPDAVRFGGADGMRRLVDDLHAEGDHVLLWWPMWARNITRIPPATMAFRRGAPAEQVVDPTATGFENDTLATVSTLLGSGPGQLDADGLKLDWGYDIPVRLSDPSLGWGAAALHRYLAVLHTAAHTVRPEALIDASAAAPQFAAVADAVRLYDAWSIADWNRRAQVVSAVDPDTLIDGDGWQATAADIIAHTVSSTVYGTPAIYYATEMVGGRPIPPALAEELGAVVALSPDKGQGRARELAGGDWEYVANSTVRARSFDGDTGLVVWRSADCATALATRGGPVVLPVGARSQLLVSDAGGHRIRTLRTRSGLSLVMAAGRPYTLERPGHSC